MLALASTLLMGSALQAQSTMSSGNMGSNKTSQSTMSSGSMSSSKSMPSDAQIADAKSKGMVWVNMNSKVYHKDDQFYGKTKNGQFMTEADAQKAGAHMAKASPMGAKKSSSMSNSSSSTMTH